MSTPKLFPLVLMLALIVENGTPIRSHAWDNPLPVTYYLANGVDIITLDPQRVEDRESITAIEQLFLGLTDIHPVTNEFVPELATDWTISEDRLTWTFTIRDNVPWVRYDPATGTFERLRNVTAADVAYGIQRACDPRFAGYFNQSIVALIVGCEAVFNADPKTVQDTDFAQIAVRAPDDVTLEISLTEPAEYFLSLTTLWSMRPVMPEVIAEYGESWTSPGTIVTNGPFALVEWLPGVRWEYVRNPYLPDDLRGPGNVERVEVEYREDVDARYAKFQDSELDQTSIPSAELETVRSDPAYADKLIAIPTQVVYYYGLNQSLPPFDNVHVRRAFSAMIDRERLVQEVGQNRGLPMIHLSPPEIFGAPPIDQVGVGYDPDYARAELAAGGYSECAGLPAIVITSYFGTEKWGESLVQSAEDVLGCDPDIFAIEHIVFSSTPGWIDYPPDGPVPALLWTSGWFSDYPDAHNWLANVLGCNEEPSVVATWTLFALSRPCNETDDLIAQAAAESDPAVRTALYAEIEERFFGPEGEYPILPLYMRVDFLLRQRWIAAPLETDGLFAGVHYDWVTIDQIAQLAARKGKENL